MKVIGIALANGLVGISGGLVAQYSGFADIGMGIGSIVFGLAAVIIGESALGARSLGVKILSVIVGSVAFRIMVALALYVGLNPIDLKLITALFVLAILIMPKILEGRHWGKDARRLSLMTGKKPAAVIAGLAFIAMVIIGGYWFWPSKTPVPTPKVRIGVVQLTDHALLNITRDSFVQEMEKLGYPKAGIHLENAQGDMATVNSILDKFVQEKMDVIVPISTGCTQAAIHKIKDKSVVFATVANPFIIGAGKSDTDHLPNVTGVHGAAPMDKMIDLAMAIVPGKIKIGAMWDPSQANAVFNLEQLKNVVATKDGIQFAGVTVTGSADVYQAAQALVQQGIDAFVLVPDNIVYSAFESIVKAAETKKIPIFLSDVERIHDGALAACGYDYTQSGIQAARIVDRIIKGEKPADIPFERYRKITIGINLDVANKFGIKIPQDVLSSATLIVDGSRKDIGKSAAPDTRPKRLAMFLFSDTHILKITADGIMDAFKKSGVLEQHSVTVDFKNAQNDHATAQAIVQDMVRRDYDYIVTVSSLALQATANGNRKIPHIFGAVTDPYRMGIAKSPVEHIPNITGVATFQPVESTIKLMRAIFPNAKKIGIIWNPSEANSEACTLKARVAAKKFGFELIEKNVTATDEIKDALTVLLNKKIDLFFTSGDNTVILAQATVAKILQEHKIPYFTNDPSDIERGSFISIGADYYEVGRETAKIAERVINGEAPENIPIEEYAPEKIGLHLGLANVYRIKIPDEVVRKAAVVKR
ncbi:MAG: hypothetical protein JW943_05650, partial [Deltaproteobacteria bacterium]|nr:hypothetical protein [Deltaproteobacteria bacterium]